MESLQRELKRGTLELILLKLLSHKPMYGYEIVSTLEAKGGEIFSVQEGTLYPVLYRLEDKGYISSYRDNPARGVPRKYYKLTAAGIEISTKLETAWRDFAGVIESILQGEEAES